MASFIYLTKTEDWENVNLDDITFFTNIDVIRTLIKMWDSRFPIRYFKYRSQVKDIALKQWTMPFITELPEEINDDDWFVPCDDDDWIHPSLESFLEHQSGDFVYWDSFVNQTHTKHTIHKWFSFHEILGPNNFAIRGSLLNRAGDQSHFLTHDHTRSIDIARDLRADIKEHKDKILSCYNYHPGSISALHRLLEQYGTIRGTLPVGTPLDCPKWLEPSYSELVSVIEKLKKQILIL